MTTRTESDILSRPLLDQLSARGLVAADPDDLGVGQPSGPFTATLVRRGDDLVAVVLSPADEDESSGLLDDAVAAGLPGSACDLPTAAASLEEVAAQVALPLDVVVVSRDGRPIGFLAVPVDRRSAIPAATSGTTVPGAPALGARPIDTAGAAADGPLGLLRNVALEVTVELGRASLTLAQLLGLGVGSVVELDRAAGSPVDIRVNGMLFGRGEVVVVGDEYAVRVIEIHSTGLQG